MRPARRPDALTILLLPDAWRLCGSRGQARTEPAHDALQYPDGNDPSNDYPLQGKEWADDQAEQLLADANHLIYLAKLGKRYVALARNPAPEVRIMVLADEERERVR